MKPSAQTMTILSGAALGSNRRTRPRFTMRRKKTRRWVRWIPRGNARSQAREKRACIEGIRARNFRVPGDGTTAPELDLELNPGLNILVGENDAGNIVDAIRQSPLTTSYESVRQDFNIHGSQRSSTLWIEATLCELSKEQQATVLEWLTLEEDSSRFLWSSTCGRNSSCAQASKRARVDMQFRAGKDGAGQEIGYAVRELIRATYLRPLRDAEAEL